MKTLFCHRGKSSSIPIQRGIKQTPKIHRSSKDSQTLAGSGACYQMKLKNHRGEENDLSGANRTLISGAEQV